MYRNIVLSLPVIATGCVNIQPVVDTFAPDIVILAPFEGSTHNPAAVPLCAHVFDEDPIDVLDVVLTSDIDGVMTPAWGLCSGGNFGATVALSSEGTHVLTLTAVDSAKNENSATVSIEALEDAPAANTAPSCTISSPEDGATFTAGSALSFDATVADLEDEPSALTVVLNSDMDGILTGASVDSAGLVQLELTDMSTNAHTLTLTVSDSEALSGTCVVSITIEAQ